MNTRGNQFAQRVLTSVCLLLIGFGLVRDARAQGLPASLTNGLVAFFPFNGNANDESGNGHHGTFIGSQITLTNGVNGSPSQAYRFTGPASENRISGSGINLVDSSLSVSFWFKKDYSNFGLEHGWLFSVGTVGNSGKVLHVYVNYAGATFGFGFYFNDLEIPYRVGENEWTHVVCTYDNASRARQIFMNGALIASDVAQYGFSGTDIFSLHAQGGGQISEIAGLLDQMRFYNRVLTPSEVIALNTGEKSQLPWLSVAVKSIQVQMHVEIGKTYQLESSTNLTTWTPYGLPFTAFATTYTIDVDVAAGYRYFQVREYVAP